jgi:hypothetical protein
MYANLTAKKDDFFYEDIEKFMVTILYPMYILFKIGNYVGDKLTKILFE